jgi:esterase/lipase
MKLKFLKYLLLFGGFAALVVIFFVGSSLSSPYPSKVGKIPSYLSAKEVSFEGARGNELSGWYLEGEKELGGILLMHGIRANRLQMVNRAKFLNEAGYSVLLFDSQGHGESAGEKVTFGYLESKDAEVAFDYLESRLENKSIGVIGISLGGAAALLGTVGERTDALILESVYPTIDEAVENRIATRVGPLNKILTPMLLWQTKLRLGFFPSELAPIKNLENVKGGVFIISGENDLYTTVEETQTLFDEAVNPKKIWLVEGAGHVNLDEIEPIKYKEQVLDFFNKYMCDSKGDHLE